MIRSIVGNKKIVIDLGCGTGNFTSILAQVYSDAQISAIDISPAYIKYANMHYPRENIKYNHLPVQNFISRAAIKNCSMFIAKGSYHLFEHDLKVAELIQEKSIVFLIIEKTKRSLETYPVPELAQRKRIGLVSDEVESNRLSILTPLSVQTYCFGEYLRIPIRCYVSAVRNRQFSYLKGCSDTDILEWEKQISRLTDSKITIFEENYIYRYFR